MQIANIMLAIGGAQSGTTVPKFNVTPAEIAVLRHMHGEDSVFDIVPVGTVQRAHRAERQRLAEKYGRSIEGRFKSPAVDELFPGAAARVFERLDELDLPEEFFKAERRVKSSPLDRDHDGSPGGSLPAADRLPAELVEQAEALGVGVDHRWSAETLAANIEAAKRNAPDTSDTSDTSDDDNEDGIGDMPDAGDMPDEPPTEQADVLG